MRFPNFRIVRNGRSLPVRYKEKGETICHKTLQCANVDRSFIESASICQGIKKLETMAWVPSESVGEKTSESHHEDKIFVEVLCSEYWGESITEDQALRLT